MIFSYGKTLIRLLLENCEKKKILTQRLAHYVFITNCNLFEGLTKTGEEIWYKSLLSFLFNLLHKLVANNWVSWLRTIICDCESKSYDRQLYFPAHTIEIPSPFPTFLRHISCKQLSSVTRHSSTFPRQISCKELRFCKLRCTLSPNWTVSQP